MGYNISPGISEKDLPSWLENAATRYGTFPDGRIDYTKAEIAPIVMCTLVWNGKIFIAKRGYGLADAEGYWSTVNGFIDENKSVLEIATQELAEELQFRVDPKNISVAQSYTLNSIGEKRSYIVFPCLVALDAEPQITLDHEHTEFTWIKKSELKNYHTLDDLSKAIDSALSLL